MTDGNDDINGDIIEDVLQLNIGGVCYTTTAQTMLTREPESFFSQLLSPARLREEVIFYQLEGLMQQLLPYYNLKYPQKSFNNTLTGSNLALNQSGSPSSTNPLCGFITLGYRGTFAFGKQTADVKFRKLHRILVCGKANLCREVFGDTLNESRDPDREGKFYSFINNF